MRLLRTCSKVYFAKDTCVDTVGLDAEMIQKYVRYEEVKEKQIEQLTLGL